MCRPRGHDPVEARGFFDRADRGFFDRAGGEGFTFELKEAESGWVYGAIVGYCFYILDLFPSFPECINAFHEGSRNVQ